MGSSDKCNRRRFLAAAAAVTAAAPAVMRGVAWSAQRGGRAGQPARAPVTEEEIKQITEALPEPTVKPAKAHKVLVFYRCEGFYHDSIPVCNKMLELMGPKTGVFEPVFSEDMAAFDPGKLDEFDGVLFNNTVQLKWTDLKQRETLMTFVKGGKGVIGIHAATDNFPTWPEGAEMMGGVFQSHPWGAQGTWPVKLDEPDHPLNKAFGGKGFRIRDELYLHKAPYSREKLRVLVGVDMTNPRTPRGRSDGDNALAWIHRFGEGRVFYSAFGHNHPIFWNKPIVQHFLDGIQYALGDLKCDDTPSAKLDPKPEPALCPEEQPAAPA